MAHIVNIPAFVQNRTEVVYMISRNGKLILAAAISALLMTACSNDKKGRGDGPGASGGHVPFYGIWAPKLTHDLFSTYLRKKGNGRSLRAFCVDYVRAARKESRMTGKGLVLKGLLIRPTGHIFNFRGDDERTRFAFGDDNFLGTVDANGFVKYEPKWWTMDEGYGGYQGHQARGRMNPHEPRHNYNPNSVGYAHLEERFSYIAISGRQLVIDFPADEDSDGYQRVYVNVSNNPRILNQYPAMKSACRGFMNKKRYKVHPHARPEYFQEGEAEFQEFFEYGPSDEPRFPEDHMVPSHRPGPGPAPGPGPDEFQDPEMDDEFGPAS